MTVRRERILVTGGLGYIGRHVVRELLGSGREVVTLDWSSREADVLAGERVVRGDCGDRATVAGLLGEGEVSAVIHLAAHTDVGESVREPLRYYANNLAGSVVLLEEALRAGVRRFVFASSAATYGDPPGAAAVSEAAPTAPMSPYGLTKRVFEQILADVAGPAGLSFLALRYFNVAGQDATPAIRRVPPKRNLIFPLLAAAVREARRVAAEEQAIAGVLSVGFPTPDGTPVRDYVHVGDVARAHRLALDRMASGEPIREVLNVGTGRATSIRDVVAVAEAAAGRPLEIAWRPRPAGYPAYLVCDPGRAGQLLGWRAERSAPEDIFRSELAYLELREEDPGR